MQQQKQIPSLRCGMTNKRTSNGNGNGKGNCNGNPPFAMKLQRMGHPLTRLRWATRLMRDGLPG